MARQAWKRPESLGTDWIGSAGKEWIGVVKHGLEEKGSAGQDWLGSARIGKAWQDR